MFRKKDFVKCHEIDADRIQDQFNRHQHGDQVFPYKETVDPDEKYYGGQDQEPVYGYTFKHIQYNLN